MRFRSTVNLGAKLERNLLWYATAASVGLGITAFSSPAEATVIYTPAHVPITTGAFYELDLDLDGHVDFVIHETHPESVFAILSMKAGSQFNSIQVYSSRFAAALNRGTRIGSGNNFYGCQTCSYGAPLALVDGSHKFGDWFNVTNRFLGLKFVIGGQTHYGWARLTVQVQGFSIRALLTGYAYESTPNKAILAGQKSGSLDTAASDTAPADPGSLGALAQGSEGLQRWRKRYPAQGSNSEVAGPADH